MTPYLLTNTWNQTYSWLQPHLVVTVVVHWQWMKRQLVVHLENNVHKQTLLSSHMKKKCTPTKCIQIYINKNVEYKIWSWITFVCILQCIGNGMHVSFYTPGPVFHISYFLMTKMHRNIIYDFSHLSVSRHERCLVIYKGAILR